MKAHIGRQLDRADRRFAAKEITPHAHAWHLADELIPDALVRQLAELGTFGMRVPEAAGGLAMGTIDAALVMEEVGRTLASGPIAEAILAARLLDQLGGAALNEVTSGATVATLAFHDIANQPVQWLPGGAHADLVRQPEGRYARLHALQASTCGGP